MRGFALVLVVALLVGELHCARTTPSPAQAPEPPQQPQPPRRRGSPHRRAPSPPQSAVPPKQDPPPPRQVVPPQEPVVAAPPPPPRPRPRLRPRPRPRPRAINYTVVGCTTFLVFGDSTVDPGNNNRLRTTAKANFLPYGINFYGRRPTGRFSNGRLATDMLAEKLGIARTIPGFHNPGLRLGQLRKGVSFASAGSGYDDSTANRLNVESFPKQIEHFWRYKLLIQTLLGPRKAERLVNKATFVISAGTNDMLFNYLASNQSGAIRTPQYENYLIARVANYTQVMRMLGGRRFVFVGLPPIGCLPIARTLLGTGADRCDENLNQLAASFNSKLIQLLNFMKYQHHTRTSYIDTYTIIREATQSPMNFGLSEVARGCCGSGVIEVGQTCRGRKTCADPSKYLYWDAVHPTERTNQLIANVMMSSIGEIYS